MRLRVVVCERVELGFCQREEREHGVWEVWCGLAADHVHYGLNLEAHLGDFERQFRVSVCEGALGAQHEFWWLLGVLHPGEAAVAQPGSWTVCFADFVLVV